MIRIALLTAAVLTAVNFLYAYVGSKDYQKAFDRSYFQMAAIGILVIGLWSNQACT